MSVLENIRYETFAQQLARGRTLDESYVIAGYKQNNGNASSLANRPEVVSRLKEIKEIAAAKANVTIERVLAELARIAFADITSAVKIQNGKLLVMDTTELAPDITAAIAEISQGRDGIRVKFHDKGNALEKLGKHLGLFKENMELNVNVSLADLVNGSYKLEAGEIKPTALTIDHVPAQTPAEATGALKPDLGTDVAQTSNERTSDALWLDLQETK